MKWFPLWLLLLPMSVAGQDTLRLAELQDAAVRQDPRTRQLALEETATEFRLRNLGVQRLPELRITGEATRQSEVIEIPIGLPDAEIPPPPAERYEAALNVEGRLYDGGVVSAKRGVERAELTATRAELMAELYPLRMEVLEAFFNALILQERLREISTLIEDLEARLVEARAAVRAGAALPGDTAVVRAELLRAGQQVEEAAAGRRTALGVLDELTGRSLSVEGVLAAPELDSQMARVIADADRRRPVEGAGQAGGAPPRAHPQYAVFEAQRHRLERQASLINAAAMPQLSAFGKFAYGRPGLQQFTEEIHNYWIAGLRFQWAPWSWGARDRDVEVLRIRERILDVQEAAFTDRLRREVQGPLESIARLRAALETDVQIIELRELVERQTRAQLTEHAITASTYIDARTDLQEARTALLRHRAELSREQARLLTTLGIALR